VQYSGNDISNAVKRSLILAGGGMRLAYQAGVLIALEEEKLHFDHVDGTSGGIFNAGMLASGLLAPEIAKRWRGLNIKNFMSLRPLKHYFKPLNMMGYADADGIRHKIFPDLGIDIKKINTHQGAAITFNVCNFSEKSVEAVHHEKVTEDHLIAGVSLPIVMPGIKIEDQWYSDAVWIKDANLLEAVRRGAEELWLVWAIGNTTTYLPGALNQYVHMIEMSANGGLLEEYGRIEMINEEIGQGKSRYGQKNPIRLHVIKPEHPLPLDPDLYLNKIDARSLINMGYAHAKKSLKSMPKKGVPMNADATKMTDLGTRLNIRGEFHGKLKCTGKISTADFHSYMVFSDKHDLQSFDIYTSIRIDDFTDEVPCYDHTTTFRKTKEVTLIECKCSFNLASEIYRLHAKWSLGTPVDMMLGLEFKSVLLSISKEDGSDLLFDGRLFQPVKQRLRSIYTTNVRRQDGTSGGPGLKYRMTSKLFNYAV
jgi:predicted acylesterase/phospholipase RssA